MSTGEETLTKSRGRPKGTGARRVYEALRDDILHLRVAPGENIEEASLEQRFQVSRTPVREALIRLASDGLITLLPNRGAQVSQIDIADVPQFFEAMDVCQRMIMRLSALRRDDKHLSELRRLNAAFAKATEKHDVIAMSELNHDFHLATAAACGNKYFRELYTDLLSVGLRLSRSAFGTAFREREVDEGYFYSVVDQHAAMIDAMARRDADAAEALARKHTDLFRQRIIRALHDDLGADLDLAPSAG